MILPVSGQAAEAFSWVVKGAIALLFFLYGARLARETVIAGLVRWRLHLLTLSVTFILFPVIGLGWGFLPEWLLAAPLVAGMTYLCCLPSTIQSSVALVGSARGNVAAALCSASASNLIGVIISPLLIALLMHTQGMTIQVSAIRDILLQLLAPFVLGQIAHPWLGEWCARHQAKLGLYDRFTIMLIVYAAFSAAVISGVWRQVSPLQLAGLTFLCLALLVFIMTACIRLAKAAGYPVEDEIVVAFCGTQKGLAAGAPMASLLFAPDAVGLILLPLLIYHPLQLIACAMMAGRYARREETAKSPA